MSNNLKGSLGNSSRNTNTLTTPSGKLNTAFNLSSSDFILAGATATSAFDKASCPFTIVLWAKLGTNQTCRFYSTTLRKGSSKLQTKKPLDSR